MGPEELPELGVESRRRLTALCASELGGWNVLCPPLEDDRFALWPASAGMHHACPGGLAQHTLEVVEMVCGAFDELAAGPCFRADLLPRDRRVAVLAAVWHDWAKLRDYNVDYADGAFVVIRHTQFHDMVHHVHGSYQEFVARADELRRLKKLPDDFNAEEQMDVEHCILSHHGQPDWGSSRRPAIRAAIILHKMDEWSMHLDRIRSGKPWRYD